MSGIRLAVREACLVLLTLATLVTCRRLLDGWSWFEPVAVIAIVAHVTAMVMRRLRWPIAVAALGSLPMLAITLGLAFHRSTTTLGLPTGDTFDRIRDDLDAAWSTFGDIRAPADPVDGYVISIAVGFWLVAQLGDWAAFRLRSPFEAVLPSSIMFGFGALMSRGPYRETALAVWLPAVLVFLLASQIERRDAGGTWLTGTAGRGRLVLARNGALVVVVVGLLAAVVGPDLPGARSSALLDVTDIGERGDGTRFVRSPLVEVRSQLVDLPDIEVFTVRSDRHDYWRLASLDRFDGSAWSLRDTFTDPASSIRSALPSGTVTERLVQQFTITGLENVYAPAAFEPRQVSNVQGGAVDVSSELSTVVTEGGTVRGMSYEVESAIPRRDQTLLAAARPADPVQFAAQLELPADFSEDLIEEARRIVGVETQPYAQAIALQDHFRTFDYDLDVDAGQGIDRMEDFVFDVQAGYCEQFASTFAAFARVVGLPSRVAVGYTPGDFDDVAGVYRVRGIHAHAWPEVWIESAGWVRFEPTPGRGAPGDTAYTGVEEQQESSGIVPVPTTTSTQAPGDAATAGTNRPVEEIPDDPLSGEAAAADSGSASPWSRRLAVAGVVMISLPAVLAAFTAWRRQRRRRHAHDAAARIEVAWVEACEAASRVELAPDRSETPLEYCTRVERRLGSAGSSLRRLAVHTTTARYSPTPPSSDLVADASNLSGAVVRSVHQRLSRGARVRAALVPPRSPERRSRSWSLRGHRAGSLEPGEGRSVR